VFLDPEEFEIHSLFPPGSKDVGCTQTMVWWAVCTGLCPLNHRERSFGGERAVVSGRFQHLPCMHHWFPILARCSTFLGGCFRIRIKTFERWLRRYCFWYISVDKYSQKRLVLRELQSQTSRWCKGIAKMKWKESVKRSDWEYECFLN
jgi:hypothetical protein